MVAEKPDLLLDWMPSRLSSLLLGWLRYAVLDKLLGCRFRRSRFQKKNRLFFFLFFLPLFFFFLRSPLFFFFLPPFFFFFFLPSSCRPSSFSSSCLPRWSPGPSACLRHPFRYFHS